jgi:hypothetical protein
MTLHHQHNSKREQRVDNLAQRHKHSVCQKVIGPLQQLHRRAQLCQSDPETGTSHKPVPAQRGRQSARGCLSHLHAASEWPAVQAQTSAAHGCPADLSVMQSKRSPAESDALRNCALCKHHQSKPNSKQYAFSPENMKPEPSTSMNGRAAASRNISLSIWEARTPVTCDRSPKGTESA